MANDENMSSQQGGLGTIVSGDSTETVNPYVTRLHSRLKKLNSTQTGAELHGIYKQLVPSRKEHKVGGEYADLVAELWDNELSLVLNSVADVKTAMPLLQFADYVGDRLAQHAHLQNHAERIKKTYEPLGVVEPYVRP